MRGSRRRCWLALVLLGGACAAPPPPLPPVTPPEVAAEAWHFVSETPFLASGTVPPPIDTGALVRVTWWALEALPEQLFESVNSHAALVATTTGPRPFLAASELLGAARFGSVADRDEFVRELGPRAAIIGERTVVIPEGVSAAIRLRDARDERDRDLLPGEIPASVALLVRHVAADSRIALVASVTGRRNEMTGTGELDRDIGLPSTREMALLDRRADQARDACALVMRSPFTTGSARALAALIEITVPGESDARELAAALERCRADLAQGASDLSGAPVVTAVPLVSLGIEQAVAGLAEPDHVRGALVFLSDLAGSALCADAALALPADFLAQIAPAVTSELGPSPAGGEQPLRWSLERSFLRVLAQRLAKDECGPAIEAILVRHLGEVGRHDDQLGALLDRAHDADDFERLVSAANREYLEDAILSVRARAYDWLAARRRAPDGFDPMAPAKARRAALERDLDAAAAKPEGSGP